ncbi:MAG: hypothetical protein ACI89L_002724 [Phycisphaerales bacterium]|jgi:hypothetical protein
MNTAHACTLKTFALFTSFTLWGSPAALAQPSVVFYELRDVLLLPDISSPGATTTQPMTGTLRWDYEPGDFENGTGSMIQATFPWFGLGPEYVQVTFEAGSAEYTMVGSYHDYGLDVMLVFDGPLSPTGSTPIDFAQSKFDIQQGVSQQGHVLSGQLIVIDNPCLPDMNGDGILDNGDIGLFVNLFLAFDLAADMNGDGLLDNGDIGTFVSLFLAGC